MIGDSYDLGQDDKLAAALRDLPGYWKLWSACLLKTVGLPTPRGIIVVRGYNSLERDLRRFLRSIDKKTGLIRHDRKGEAPPYPRGGFLVPEKRLLEAVQSFLSEGRIVAVYEPFNRLENGYNLNLLFRSRDDVWVEIAGPGFDASNLQRGDIKPHEVLQVQLGVAGNVRNVTVVHRTTDEEYRQSVQDRISKFQELSNIRQSDSKDKIPWSNLLRTQTYSAAPRSLLVESIAAIERSGFIQRFAQLTGIGFPLNVSTSYVEGGKRQIFWDATAPSLKFQGLSDEIRDRKVAAV